MPEPQPTTPSGEPHRTAEAVDALAALRAALRHRTVAGPDKVDAEFDGLHADLRTHFPLLHAACERVDLPDHALLLRWPGRAADRPVVLMAHQDVVPTNPRDNWTHPPYEAVVDDGFVWGRGTLDCKGSLVAICAAVETLIADGFVPTQDVWLSFSSDEEVAGTTAPLAVAALQERGVDPWLVLDEGGMAVTGAFPGVSEPMAVIGLAEKGLVVLELTATGAGGHASTPPTPSAPAILAKAVLALEKRPAPASLPDPSVRMLERLAPLTRPPMRQVLANVDRARKPAAAALAKLGPVTAALVRTTYAITQLAGSPAQNVLASTATATVNMRVAVDDDVDTAVARVRKTVGKNVQVEVLDAYEPSPVAPIGEAYDLLEQVTAEVMPDVAPTPYVVMAATDARHFQRVWAPVYRFNPFRMTESQRNSLHNVDERLEVSSYLEGIDWYTTLLRRI